MSFQIRELEGGGATEWIAEWPFRARPHFIGSNAYATLKRELQRYVQGEVSGRSFLISGHRGAGKTALVRQAVEDLNRSTIEQAVAEARSQLSGGARVFSRQRPVAVKLHGPSLLGPAPAGNGAAGGAATDHSLVALEQIAIALYRALAAEFAQSYANHARERAWLAQSQRPLRQTDYLELAGQFTLELDNVPRPATLRAFFDRAGRLHSGVLWPNEASTAVGEGVNDQGVREIIALATAAQAFEVCVGEVKSTQSDKDTRIRESAAELKIDVGLSDIGKALLALGSGALVGAGIWQSLGSPAAGTAAGLLTGLTSVLAVNWSRKRSAKTEHVLDYTFIRDRTKQTLERDLPLVIQRVRDAGLAPVFIVDELDKLPNAAANVGKIIADLKHLTTDYGCFCFLTDGAYYDHVMRAVEEHAFPVEHSLFSHRFFVLHQPVEILTFLSNVAQPIAATSASPPPEGAVEIPIETLAARLSLSLYLLHRSKLNLVEILRHMAALCDASGNVRPTIDKLRSDWSYLLPAKVQLVIGVLLQSGRLRERVETDPRFTQLAADALYMLSLAWERELDSVRLDRESLVQHLLGRADKVRSASGDGVAAEAALLEMGISPLDLDIVAQAVRQLGELLSDQTKLEVFLDLTQGTDGVSALRKALPIETLLTPIAGRPDEYEFRFDIYGQDRAALRTLRVAPPATQAPAPTAATATAPLPPQFIGEYPLVEESLGAFDDLLGDAGITVADVVTFQLLPPTIASTELTAARARLRSAWQNSASYDALLKDWPMVASTVGVIAASGRMVFPVLRLAADITRAGGDKPISTTAALAAIARFVDLPSLVKATGTVSADQVLNTIAYVPADFLRSALRPDVAQASNDAERIRYYRWEFAALRATPPELTMPDAWADWFPRFRHYFLEQRSIVDPASYADILTAARDEPPGNCLRRDFQTVTAAEWSELCVLAFPAGAGAESAVPLWVLAAALRALGFGRATVGAVADFGGLSPEQREFVGWLGRQVPEDPRDAFILVMREDGVSMAKSTDFSLQASDASGARDAPGEAVLALPESALFQYDAFIAWLREHATVKGLVYEIAEAELELS